VARAAASMSGQSAPPRVSVVVPTCNRPAELGRCIDALTRLDYPQSALQIIVVNDGDAAPGVAAAAMPAEITVLRQPHQGPASARNRGARHADGEILAFTDDDCCPRPDWLTHLVGALAEEPTAMVGGRVVNGLPANVWAEASQDLISFLQESFATSRSLRPFFTTNNMALRREHFLAIGGFDAGFPLPAAEDRDLSERWVKKIGRLRFVEQATVDHFHRLDPWSFARQHHRYGRGAIRLARQRRARGDGMPVPEPLSFYFRMVA
jgi:GT2 family glycosyltransferase